jgi:hypothetical protein
MAFARSTPNLVPHHESIYRHNSLTTLVAPVTYYVNNTTGDDANDGLTSGTAFATINKALGMLPYNLEAVVTINVAAGSYSETLTLDFNSNTKEGFLNIVGSNTWTQIGTANITGILPVGDSHCVQLDRSLLTTESGMRGRFTSGPEAGTTFWLSKIMDVDTQVILSIDMTTVVSRAFEILQPSTIIVGDPTADRSIAIHGDNYLENSWVMYTLKYLLIARDNEFDAGLELYKGGVTLDTCVVDGAPINTLNSTLPVYLGLLYSSLTENTEMYFISSTPSALYSYYSSVSCYTDTVKLDVVSDTSIITNEWFCRDSTNMYLVSTVLIDTYYIIYGRYHELHFAVVKWLNTDQDLHLNGISIIDGGDARIYITGEIEIGTSFLLLNNSNRVSAQVYGIVTSIDTVGNCVVLFSNQLCQYNTYADMGTTYDGTVNMVVGPTVGTVDVSGVPVDTTLSDPVNFNIYQKISAL